MKAWNKVMIDTPHGEVPGVAPIIISASRATDIPAFYSDWFFERLKAGYLKWINPFNRKAQYVSMAEARVVVFWTKNPAPVIMRLAELEMRDINYYFMVTVNDYEAEGLEPGLPSLDPRIESFVRLSNLLGKERVIWRFDPLLLTNCMGPEKLLEKIAQVGSRIHHFTEQLVISFADIEDYAKVKAKLARNNVLWKPFDEKSIDQIAKGLQQLNTEWGLKIKTCGEKYDLSAFGIMHSHCIDAELMERLFPSDPVLMKFLGVSVKDEPTLFPEYGSSGPIVQDLNVKLKDRGQRSACGCIMSKDIGQYDTCVHQCLYCYANNSDKIAQSNMKAHSRFGESIIRDPL
ncbi:MAG: DUF1848 domain-containing protein [Desulfosporosinus sp.]|nr:DUF1848 domain-containing protein [Desulfosporosinus sp.]